MNKSTQQLYQTNNQTHMHTLTQTHRNKSFYSTKKNMKNSTNECSSERNEWTKKNVIESKFHVWQQTQGYFV